MTKPDAWYAPRVLELLGLVRPAKGGAFASASVDAEIGASVTYRQTAKGIDLKMHPDYAHDAPGLSHRKRIAYGRALVQRIYGNLSGTLANPGYIRGILADHDIPIALFNLCETARVGQGETMNRYHPESGRTSDPAVLLWALLQRDPPQYGYAATMWIGPRETAWRGRTYQTWELIEQFARRAVDATSSDLLFPILFEWLEAFGNALPHFPSISPLVLPGEHVPPPDAKQPRPRKPKSEEDKEKQEKGEGEPEPGEGKGDGDEEQEGEGEGKGDGEDEGDGDEEEEESEAPGVGYGEPEEPHEVDPDREIKLPEDFKRGERTLTSQQQKDIGWFRAGSPNLNSARTIALKLGQMLSVKDSARVRTSMSGSRLHMPNLVAGSSDAFRASVTRGGIRRLCVLMDMSGSMGSRFHYHGGAFLAALIQLHRQRRIVADLWLSGGGRCFKLPPTTPLSELQQLGAGHSNESIDATLKTAHADVIAAESVLIYTDGFLTDGDVHAGEWRQKGVDLIGVATDNGDQHEKIRANLEQHFSRALVESSGTKLAARIMQYVLTRP